PAPARGSCTPAPAPCCSGYAPSGGGALARWSSLRAAQNPPVAADYRAVSPAVQPDQDAVAELREGQGSGRGRRQRRVREVDFARPTKFTQDQQRRIARGHDSFCRAVSTLLSAEVRTAVELEVVNVDQQTWSSAVGEIPQPSLLAVIGTS